MSRPVRIAPTAKEQLRGIRDPSVVAEILEIAYRDLAVPPRGGLLDGAVSGQPSTPDLWWRRAVPFHAEDQFVRLEVDDEDEDAMQACDYVLLYRPMTRDEQNRFGGNDEHVLVVDVRSNDELLGFYFAARSS